MKIVVDIGHPAHVHLFKNFIWEMEKRGHEILITATKKDVSMELLDNYGFDYIAMGSYGNSVIKKLINVPIMDLKMYYAVKDFAPDILVGLGSIRCAHVSKLMRKPCIAFDDTECSPLEHILYIPFTNVVLTPSCFRKDFGKKQIRYNGYHELAYLHPNYFKPDPSVLGELGISESDRFVILRFVAWAAVHDIGHYGFDMATKRKLVNEIERYARVFISSEGPLPEEFERYRITTPPDKIHDLLYYAALYVGEGATIATEAAVLGTPSIYISSLLGTMGNFIELEQKYGLTFNFSEPDKGIEKAIELIQKPNLKVEWARKREELLKDKCDVTAFMVWFIENYPESFHSVPLEYTTPRRGGSVD